jgi:sulfur-carrier protein
VAHKRAGRRIAAVRAGRGHRVFLLAPWPYTSSADVKDGEPESLRPLIMALVRVRGPLKKLAGDRGEHDVAGASVADLLRELERRHPPVSGWILDERGRIRRHINVFVNGERGRETTAVGDADRIDVLPAISGGDGA